MVPIIIIAFVLLRLLAEIIPTAAQRLQKKWQLLLQKIKFNPSAVVFENNFLEVKAFYSREFNRVPCISYINNIDVTKAFDYINAGRCGRVKGIYQYT